ncbi:hypothetical protein JW887_04925 [Candidatus Dojkabacteria bacterium]|nr:hypothetical protein [Candidatus Dojkabacteria bacterium]
MRIYIEGVACAGKTEFIDKLSHLLKSCSVIHELPTDIRDKDINTAFCRKNDEAKCAQALAQEACVDYVLVDRCYPSTLAYEYIQFSLGIKNEYVPTLHWYYKGIVSRKLSVPDLYVYMNIDEEVALRRAHEIGRYSTKYAWFKLPRAGNHFYQKFYDLMEPYVPMLNIDGAASFRTQYRSLIKKINSIYEEKK